MSKALTMDEAAAELRVSRRALQDILKRHPFYYPNGRRKLFTEADIEAIRHLIGDRPQHRVFRYLAERLPIETMCQILPLLGGPTSVYIVRCADRVKIGYTTNWPARFRILKTSCPHPVEVVALIPAARLLETFLHRGLGEARRHGEWFEATGQVTELVAAFEGATP